MSGLDDPGGTREERLPARWGGSAAPGNLPFLREVAEGEAVVARGITTATTAESWRLRPRASAGRASTSAPSSTALLVASIWRPIRTRLSPDPPHLTGMITETTPTPNRTTGGESGAA